MLPCCRRATTAGRARNWPQWRRWRMWWGRAEHAQQAHDRRAGRIPSDPAKSCERLEQSPKPPLECRPNGKGRLNGQEDVVMIGPRWTRPATHAAIIAASLACLSLADVAIAASSAYDGVYRGEVTRTRGDESVCGKATWTASYTVVNGQFSIVYD